MPEQDDTAAALAVEYEAKAAAEIAEADRTAPGSDSVRWSGSLVPEVVAVKGSPGPAESTGGPALSGADGEALAKALAALGYEPEQVFAVMSRPDRSIGEHDRAQRLRLVLEAVDAPLVLALDEQAAADVTAAFGLGEIVVGAACDSHGRRLVAVEDFEASLADEDAKKRVWRQMQAAAPKPAVY